MLSSRIPLIKDITWLFDENSCYVSRLWIHLKMLEFAQALQMSVHATVRSFAVCVFAKKRCQGTKLSHNACALLLYTSTKPFLHRSKLLHVIYFYPIKIEFKVCKRYSRSIWGTSRRKFFHCIILVITEKGHLCKNSMLDRYYRSTVLLSTA